MEELAARHEVVRGKGNVRGLATGCKFELTDHPLQDLCQSYLVTSTTLRIESDVFDSQGTPQGQPPTFECEFAAMDSQRAVPYAAGNAPPGGPGARRRPWWSGPSGEEIWTDKYGRVKVQFHWDRYSKADENSSCWIRVAQAWAGKKWGSHAHSADRAGGDRRVPRGRPRPPDHHRPGVQRRCDAAVHAAG